MRQRIKQEIQGLPSIGVKEIELVVNKRDEEKQSTRIRQENQRSHYTINHYTIKAGGE